MFSSRRLLKHAHKVLSRHHHWTKRKILIHVLAGTLLLAIFWSVSALGALRTFIPNTLQLTGWPGTARNYLILFQNDTELRATGGFITAYALLEFNHGLPTGISFNDVYGEIDDHDYISPPYPMDELLEKNSDTYAGHSFRDANYNPNFLEAKEDILDFFYKTYYDVEIDGLFAVNFSVLEDVVGLYEPVKIDGLTLTEENLFETLETAVSDIDRHNLEALSTRKDIIKQFAFATLKEMIFSPWQWRNLSDVITRNLNEKDILLSFENSTLSKKVAHYGWDGAFPEPDIENPFDLLAVNVSNFGGMKSDRYLTREVHYNIDLSTNTPTATAEVTLRHNGEYNVPLSGEYKGYVRVFVPKGATLTSIGSTEESMENYVGWGDIVKFDPGETATFTYEIELNPQTIQEDTYRLELIKQPGTENDYYEITVKTPAGSTLQSNQFDVRENIAFFKDTLNYDKTLELEIFPDESGPRIFYHELPALNQIDIGFAETLDIATASDPLNYEITDLDYANTEITDQIYVDYIDVWDGHVRLHTRGMDYQDEEHFSIQLRNIRDTNGNLISPNPRTVTVVQRLTPEN
ncbi:DUF4012 domain-containing protein [Candidatus Peregrinibacteria bacterium]|jgi:hypothetical protein|nr:DUF4012 domain-containing protein [Candidatus Peregrinibacteria bacterium]MBT7703327.1 DUF4012 domain-containing protein [Candidatus Peregrinibacteria bacterium]